MNKLNDILESLDGKSISKLMVNDNEILPFEKLSMSLRNDNVKGTFSIRSGETVILFIHIRDGEGNFKKYPFIAKYNADNEIIAIQFNTIFIQFEKSN